MTEKRFEAYYDDYMKDWKVQDTLTLDIYPCVSEKVAEAFADLLNGLYCSDLKLLKSNDFLLKENEELKQRNKKMLKVMFALKNYVENGDYERINNAVEKIKEEILND